jgi:hypothetical protein
VRIPFLFAKSITRLSSWQIAQLWFSIFRLLIKFDSMGEPFCASICDNTDRMTINENILFILRPAVDFLNFQEVKITRKF